MLIFRFIILFCVTTRIVLHVLVLKQHISSLILSSAAALSEILCFSQLLL